MKNTAPYFDEFIRLAQTQKEVTDKSCIETLLQLYDTMSIIEVSGEDELRSIWIEIPRGTIEDYGDYKEFLEEGIVECYKDFEELWNVDYPEESRWYEVSSLTYDNNHYFFVDSVLSFQIASKEDVASQEYFNNELISWFYEIMMDTLDCIKKDVAGYNNYLNNKLSYNRRFGKLFRKDFWSIFPDEELSFQSNLSSEDMICLEAVVHQSIHSKNDQVLKRITAGDFFEFCRIGYIAVDYFKTESNNLNAVEMYKRMADGRDDGLTRLDLDSEEDFKFWMKNKIGGSHPWEICRGGNSTHISLYVQSIEYGWTLNLAGSSRARVLETVKMAIALFKKHIPFVLRDAEEIFRMVSGTDYIGIVPKTILPRYCGSHFPPNDRIIDFMQLGYEETSTIIEKTLWYPLREIRMCESHL
jgi:hypothetical protein